MTALSTLSHPRNRTVLSIAGHDPSSGAGITADLQTFAAHHLFGTSAVTAYTVQSTQGIDGIQAVDPLFLQRVLNYLSADLTPSGVKIGMLGSAEIAATVAEFLRTLRQGNADPQNIPIVLDPVLRSSSGATLLQAEALETLHARLIPNVSWITPNWSELSALSGKPVQSLVEAEAAAHGLAARHPHLHIVATAGDHTDPTDLLRMPAGEIHRFSGQHIASISTHGTGCAFSSALLCFLVLGETPFEAVRRAKEFTTEAIHRAPGIGHGRGPLNLLWPLSP